MNRSAPAIERNVPAKRRKLDGSASKTNAALHSYSKSSTRQQPISIANQKKRLASRQNTVDVDLKKIHYEASKTDEQEPEETEIVCQRLIELQAMSQRAERLHAKNKEKLIRLHERSNQSLLQEIRPQQAKIQELRLELETIQQQADSKKNKRKQQEDEIAAAKATIEKTAKAIEQTKRGMPTLSERGQQLDQRMHEKEMALEDVKKRRATTQQEIISMEQSLMQAAQQRRKLYNTIQELKGNIRVFCRVRPVLSSDKSQQHTQIRYSSDDITDTMELEGDIFKPSTSQSECYEDIAYLVQSALDGYSVCIFAYGQTGSGKTYTMQGPATNVTPETAGMIPRAIEQIYDLIQELKKEGWEYSMEGQFLEIYNETIHDLLGDPTSYGKVKHEIHHAKNGRTTVSQLKTVHLDSPATLHAMLRRANYNRATGATNMNERSSRSHSVFTLRISGFNRSAKETCTGVLNLVDLAGSERLTQSGATGERLKETQAINKSLSSLGDVIHALNNNSKTENNAHVPYRNSKLTYLLQNSLGGTSKTLMFVNISPLAEHFNETLCSLRFASKVNACRVELPQRVLK
ncbi:hypothetical protein LRAMOSA09545 [Lichtheimia ramosa]|uniref:Kinesin-like protein n=1 Tax=Lichtheimia ramosa TaxID=688394 RepID=A0A077WKF5_9FUNG|nr:hypothetical protein LRAMOSA09545 [Lichtheimia ramosa]